MFFYNNQAQAKNITKFLFVYLYKTHAVHLVDCLFVKAFWDWIYKCIFRVVTLDKKNLIFKMRFSLNFTSPYIVSLKKSTT